ncbi:MAG: respiratory nitrate reductase subunit gamma [Candidatus Zixiibacteriota bacterium]
MSGLQVISYLSIAVFPVLLIAKMVRIARMPVHLRWDLYPIPHEKGKSAYGGSYFEEVDWWTKPRVRSLISELREMAKEIVFIHSVYKHNRPLWVFSFPFHIGMYCLIGLMALLVIGAIMGAAGIVVSADSANGFAVLVQHLTRILGAAGWILSVVGVLGLLFSRLLNRELRVATILSDYVNLLALLAVFATGLVSWITVDPSYAIMRGFVRSLITFQPVTGLPAATATHLWLMAGLLFYFPFTHMTHMVGKYFTYHKVRWEDEPNIRGTRIEQAVQAALGYKITWSAPHIKTGSTWADAAMTTGEVKNHE